MPKQTFFNLPEEKRRAIVDIAIEAFADKPYGDVSISGMVERAGIAKGSFYQYFTDKKDLFFYLLDLAAQQKMAMLKDRQPPDPRMGLFATIRFLMEAGMEYQFANPRLNEVAYRAIYGTLPFQDESLQRLKDASMDYYRGLVEIGRAHGEIDPRIDQDAAAFVLGAVFNDFGNFFLRRIGADPHRMLERNFSAAEKQVLHESLDQVIEVLRRGLGARD